LKSNSPCIDLNKIFKAVFQTLLADRKWASTTAGNFKLIEIENSIEHTGKNEVFGTSAYLHYELKWPLNLVVSKEHIDRYVFHLVPPHYHSYNQLFYFFCTIKKILRRLVALNHQILNRSVSKIPQVGLALCSRQLFFLNSLWSYIQVISIRKFTINSYLDGFG
jgi:hypothetical protein